MQITDFLNKDYKSIQFQCDKLITFREMLQLAQKVTIPNLRHTNYIGVGIFRKSILMNNCYHNTIYFTIDSITYHTNNLSPPIVIYNYNFDDYLDLTLIEIFERFKLLELFN